MEVFLILWWSWHSIYFLHHWKNISQYVTSWMHSWGECSSHLWLTGYMVANVQLYNFCTVEVAAWSHLQDLAGLPEATCNTWSNIADLEQEEWHCPISIILLCTHIKLLGKPLSQAVPWTLTSRCQDTITTALTPWEERVIPEANHAVSQQNDFVYFSFSGFGCWVVIITVSLVKGLWWPSLTQRCRHIRISLSSWWSFYVGTRCKA